MSLKHLAIPLVLGALDAAAAEPPTGLHPVSVAAPAIDGPGKEVAVVADLPFVKIVAITLRAGTALPEHTAPVPVTIQAAHGTATLTVAGVSTPLAAGAFVLLDPSTPHAVKPSGSGPVVVLVHHHKGGGQ